LGGTGTLWLAGSHVSGGAKEDGTRSARVNGYAMGLIHKIGDLWGGFQRFTVQLGGGALTDFNTYYKPTVMHLPDGAAPGDMIVPASKRLRLTETLQIQPIPAFSLMGVAIYQYTDFGAATMAAKESWYSLGVRPIVHTGPYFSIAAEAGVDYVHSTFAASG